MDARSGCAVKWPDDLRLEPEQDLHGDYGSGFNETDTAELGSGDASASGIDTRYDASSGPEALLSEDQPNGIGVGCTCFGALLVALGTNLMRRAARSELSRPAHRQRVYVLQPVWWLGALVLGMGPLGTCP